MPDSERYPFIAVSNASGQASLMPWLPVSLTYGGHSVSESGLLDTGATVNVLPFQTGITLGAAWDESAGLIHLSGNLARYPAIPLIVTCTVGKLASVRMAFAWTQAEGVPVILGQVNFFMEFDVCFYRSQQLFEVRTRN